MVAEVPLVDIMAVKVLLAELMEAEVDLVEEEVREVTAKPHSLFLFNLLTSIRGFLVLGNLL